MKILNMGSLNLDYVYTVEHIAKSGESIAALTRSEYCGGKGLNQSIALARAGAEVFHAGCIGPEGGPLKDRLEESGVDTSLIRTTQTPTGHAIIQVTPEGENSIIVHGGANLEISETDVDHMLEGFHRGDILLLQNETSCRDYAIRQASKKGMLVALNPSPIDDTLKTSAALHNVRWFILNEIEGYELSGETEPHRICAALRQKYDRSVVVLTLGENGVTYFDGESRYHHGIYRVPVTDTTAAGDTFAGYFIASTATGDPAPTALSLASKASALAVSRAGASDSIPTMCEVLSAAFEE